MFCFQNTCWPSSSWSPGQRSKMWSYCQRCWKQWSRDDEFLKQCKVAANFARDKVCPQAFPTPITRTAVGGLGSSPSYIPPSGIPLNFCSLSLNPALLYSVGICTISVWFHCSIYNINICLFGLCCPFSPKLHWAVWVDSSILSAQCSAVNCGSLSPEVWDKTCCDGLRTLHIAGVEWTGENVLGLSVGNFAGGKRLI